MFAGIPRVSLVYDAHMLKVNQRDVWYEEGDIREILRKRATDGQLVTELEARGFQVSRGMAMHPDHKPSQPEDTDLDRWLEVWTLLAQASENRNYLNDYETAFDKLLEATMKLFALIQPPSVRVARQFSDSDAEASSRT